MPSFDLERTFWARGLARVAGVDEAGRGAWAGPVVVAAVVLPQGEDGEYAFRDSKTLAPARREVLAAEVKRVALGWSVEFASAADVDEQGVLNATRAAALRAVLRLAPDALVTDYLRLDSALPCLAPPRADSLSYSAAAASLLAKTARDAFMCELDATLPGYGFARHKGYGTADHAAALAALGVSTQHRTTFRPVALALK